MRSTIKNLITQSMMNGIVFYSNYHKEYASIATIDEDNNISLKWTKVTDFYKKSTKSPNQIIKKGIKVSGL